LMDVVFSKWLIPTMTHLGMYMGLRSHHHLNFCFLGLLVSPSWTLLGGVKLEVLLSHQRAAPYVSHFSHITSDFVSDIGSLLSLFSCLLCFILRELISCAVLWHVIIR
jgi:TRAP-type C4-dicarboxylate transport system permease small subunit